MSLLDDRLTDPPHLGPMESPSAVGAVGNPACGDVVTLYLRIEDDTIVAASFESIGSRYQLATASTLCDCVLGQRIEDAKMRGPGCVLKRLPDLPARNRYLAHLAIDALKRAIQRYESKAPAVHADSLRELDEDQARAFVRTLLGARPMATMEVEAMAEAEGCRLPQGTARFLSRLRKEGTIESSMSEDKRSWRWSMAEARRAP